MGDTLKTTPVIGFLASTVGITAKEDNHGNIFSGKSLKCTDDNTEHKLGSVEAFMLHEKIGLENGLFGKGLHAIISNTTGTTELGVLSPLQTKCQEMSNNSATKVR